MINVLFSMLFFLMFLFANAQKSLTASSSPVKVSADAISYLYGTKLPGQQVM